MMFVVSSPDVGPLAAMLVGETFVSVPPPRKVKHPIIVLHLPKPPPQDSDPLQTLVNTILIF